MTDAVAAPAALDAFVIQQGLVSASAPRQWTPLTGGVSSDIWRLDSQGKSLCVKRALPKLKVAADWHAPVSRNSFEWAWLNYAATVLPQAVPQPIAHDEQAGLFVMSFLEPESHPVWKQQLLDGQVQVSAAAAVGRSLGILHQASAHNKELAQAFDTGENFHALRLEPYLLATARKYPALQEKLTQLSERTAARRDALVHGDVSPKNILIGPQGPVILDAECAWYGDPAFDLAFCLNHLLLKTLPRPECSAALHQSFDALVEAYFKAVHFEARNSLESRAAQLLPALFLARIDGKSPVEYITLEEQKERVRQAATAWISAPQTQLAALSKTWFRSL